MMLCRGTETEPPSWFGRRRSLLGIFYRHSSNTAISLALSVNSTLMVFAKLQRAGGSFATICFERERGNYSATYVEEKHGRTSNNLWWQGAAAGGQESDEDQRSSSTSSLSGYTILVDENKRLKKENGDLSSELTSMKRKCKELLDLVAKYANLEKQEDDDDERPKLFGVRLDVGGDRKERKRKRAIEISESAGILLSQSCK
ncbi:hypothetical protein Dsin_011861 [Dipteronia sinensis]|uniref:Uncharacterized protein n=1 Tax=Dipteronia sinensis TaxID=43782 RepID=A0AAE0AH73_9ROSI|nr:hypothetical protein Dsin_011861 [Dipteronia sinensis]